MNKKLIEEDSESLDLDFSSLVPKKRYLRNFEGRDWDVSVIPANVSLALTAWSYEREDRIISFEHLLEAAIEVINKESETPFNPADLRAKYTLDQLIAMVNYVLSPVINTKPGEAKNSDGTSSEATS